MDSVRLILARQVAFLLCGFLALAGCDGSSKKTPIVSSSSSTSSGSSSFSNVSSASSAVLIISGTATYDFVPHHADYIGLNYAATQALPIRGALVELVDASDGLIARGVTDENGDYSLLSPRATPVRVRVKAHLLREDAPRWDISVTDNTRGNALYVLTGGLVDSGSLNSRRNLHAPSGWSEIDYSATRAAAPFAILDAAYTGLQRLRAAGSERDLKPLEFRWSTRNVTAVHPDHDLSTGEIGTSFFDGAAIYLLGEADVDTDEYDSHVVLHEWTHYLEVALARSDTIGGAHGYADRLDLRVAHSEGFANALAAMMLDDEYYRDSGGVQQAGGYAYDIGVDTHTHAGWYNEASVESILYNYYRSATDKNAHDLTYVIDAFTAEGYRHTPGFTSIHLFAEQLQSLYPTHQNLLDMLLNEQLIFGRGIYGDGETNSANYAGLLPIYKFVQSDAVPVNICSSSRFGKYNKLGVAQFIRLDITEAGEYDFLVTKNGGDAIVTDPDFILFERGSEVARADSTAVGSEALRLALAAGEYLIEVYDWNNRDERSTTANTTCFDVQVSQQVLSGE